MEAEWPLMPLSEAAEINPRVRLKKGVSYPFVNMADVTPGNRDVAPSERRVYKGGGSRFERGDTLLARITPCLENGKTARYWGNEEEDLAHGSTEFIVFRGREGVTNSDFVNGLVRSPKVQDFAILHMTGSSGRQRVPTDALAHLNVRIPPLQEQRRIAAVLGALDDKIELNRRMNRTLEALSQALFRRRFVRPYLAHQDGEPLPDGWRLGSPEDLVDINPRIRIKRDTPTRYLGMSEVPTEGFEIGTLEEREFTSGSKFEQGDTLLARITPSLENGKTALVTFLEPGEKAYGSTEFIVLRGQDGVPPEFVYCLARSPEFRDFAIGHMTGSSGRQRVPNDVFAHFEMAVPDADALDAYGREVAPLFERIVANHRQSRTLAALRDALLPELVSGRLRVPESLDLSART